MPGPGPISGKKRKDYLRPRIRATYKQMLPYIEKQYGEGSWKAKKKAYAKALDYASEPGIGTRPLSQKEIQRSFRRFKRKNRPR